MTTQLVWLRAHLRTLLGDVHGEEQQPDEDGDFPLRWDTAFGWVGAGELDGDLFVEVVAIAAHGLRPTAAVLREVNELCTRAITAKVFLHDGSVTVCQRMPAESLTEDALRQALHQVSGAAVEVGTLFATVHGGATPFEPAIASG